MLDWIDGAHYLRSRRRLLGSTALALTLCRCAVYDGGLVDHASHGGISSGSGGNVNQTGDMGGQGPTGGTDVTANAGSNASVGGSAGAINPESGGAAGTTGQGGSAEANDSTGGAGGAGTGTTGAGGSAGGCVGSRGAVDLPLFQNGIFVPGYSTTGSWKTCNATPMNATVGATTALAIDLSCNTFNGALIINWNSPVPPCTYSTLSFDIYFSNLSDITPLKVYLQNGQGPIGLQLNVSSLIASPQAMAFNHVSVPLSSFGIGLVFNGIGFFNANSASMPLFYVNNVVLGTGALADAGSD